MAHQPVSTLQRPARHNDTHAAPEPADDEAAIRALIQHSYFDGAFNRLDTVAMARGFHPDFVIFTAAGDALSRYPIQRWIEAIESRKAAAGFDPESAARICRITHLDITSGAASARIDIDLDARPLYTDYLSLLKFDSGWRIVAKVYVEHRE